MPPSVEVVPIPATHDRHHATPVSPSPLHLGSWARHGSLKQEALMDFIATINRPSPTLLSTSPFTSSMQRAHGVEHAFLRGFTCCGQDHADLHDLMQHHEDAHPSVPFAPFAELLDGVGLDAESLSSSPDSHFSIDFDAADLAELLAPLSNLIPAVQHDAEQQATTLADFHQHLPTIVRGLSMTDDLPFALDDLPTPLPPIVSAALAHASAAATPAPAVGVAMHEVALGLRSAPASGDDDATDEEEDPSMSSDQLLSSQTDSDSGSEGRILSRRARADMKRIERDRERGRRRSSRSRKRRRPDPDDAELAAALSRSLLDPPKRTRRRASPSRAVEEQQGKELPAPPPRLTIQGNQLHLLPPTSPGSPAPATPLLRLKPEEERIPRLPSLPALPAKGLFEPPRGSSASPAPDQRMPPTFAPGSRPGTPRRATKQEVADGEERRYACDQPGCGKRYKNPGGLKYHHQHAHFIDTGDPELNGIMVRPYGCAVEGCNKRYRNLGGLKYHLEHAHLNGVS
ncbi:hypothetical protein DFJ74DRAFT_701516 [Hyaloraphidium curvatum]|nr:hypothetical protein DFJ74DRAFT_701516 [Hyaloraphidium curvatum]